VSTVEGSRAVAAHTYQVPLSPLRCAEVWSKENGAACNVIPASEWQAFRPNNARKASRDTPHIRVCPATLGPNNRPQLGWHRPPTRPTCFGRSVGGFTHVFSLLPQQSVSRCGLALSLRRLIIAGALVTSAQAWQHSRGKILPGAAAPFEETRSTPRSLQSGPAGPSPPPEGPSLIWILFDTSTWDHYRESGTF